MDDSDLPVVDLALYLAYLRWRNKRRSKRGAQDEPSARARALWFKHKAISHQDAAIIEAAQELSGVADDDLQQLQRRWLLEQIRLARRAVKKSGRPLKRLSLMAVAMQRAKGKRPIGRPAIGLPEDAAKWVAYMSGLKLRLFMEGHGWTPGGTQTSALDTLARAANAAGIDPTRYLDREVKDREVLADPHSQGLGPPTSLATMAKRLQRARQKHPFLPKQLKPSK